MSVIDKLEKEYEEEPKRQKSQVNIFERIVGDKEYSQPLDPQVKKEIRGLLDMLNDFYDTKIGAETSTLQDAFEYIPLFTVNGALIASMLGITYEEYLTIVDTMIVLLGLDEGEEN